MRPPLSNFHALIYSRVMEHSKEEIARVIYQLMQRYEHVKVHDDPENLKRTAAYAILSAEFQTVRATRPRP